MSDLKFPPLFAGMSVAPPKDPFRQAQGLAIQGADPGTVVYQITPQALRAAILFTPEVPLEKSLAMMPVCGLGFQNALGSLAPPEVAVHLEWDGDIRINGAKCGRLQAAASTDLSDAEPDWLVVGLTLQLRYDGTDPGEDVDATALYEEGCADVDPGDLIESWVRHTLYWINRWQEDGNRPVLTDWRGFLHDVGEAVEFCDQAGTFVGIDDDFRALLRIGDQTRALPLSKLLEGS